MKTNFFMSVSGLFLLLFSAGCQHPQATAKTGAELIDKKKGSELVTYVSIDEYERMSPEERERLHATMGADVTIAEWGTKKDSEPFTREQFDETMKKAAQEKNN